MLFLLLASSMVEPPAVFATMFNDPTTMLASAAAVYIASVLALLNAFAVLGRYFPAEKQRAWVLTTIASCAMTAASLPFMRDYLTGWGIVAVQPRVEFAVVVNRFFQVRCSSIDLAIHAEWTGCRLTY
jgi:hypothetical protein